jgi:uncharacterized membrane protein YhhN
MIEAVIVVSAVGNWVARWREHQIGEWITKPLVTGALIVAAATLTPVSADQRAWFVVGFALCLLGDVLLMPPVDSFEGGLGAFLLAHVAFIAGFLVRGHNATRYGRLIAILAIGLLVMIVVAPVLAEVRKDHAPLALPVLVYVLAILAMVVVAAVYGGAWGLAGALAFAVSDSMLAWNRFMDRAAWRHVAIMITYHLALIGFVTSLTR